MRIEKALANNSEASAKEAEQRIEELLKSGGGNLGQQLVEEAGLKSLLEQVSSRLGQQRAALSGPVEEDPEYQLIVRCNVYQVRIADEIAACHKALRDRYAQKFPELEGIVLNPVDYARVVLRIGNQSDITRVPLQDLIPPATIMVISVSSITSRGQLSPEQLQRIEELGEVIVRLDEARRRLLEFVESRMNLIAPNLSHMLGTSVAAKLMSAAGGLTALSKLPASVVQILGASRRSLAGFSSVTVVGHARAGYIIQCEMMQRCPPAYRTRLLRVLSGKVTLAARVDAFNESPSGEVGRRFLEEIARKLEKWQEPPPLKQPKPLPAPDDKPRKRRGGKRVRKMKEKYGMTDLRRLKNRVAFGVQEQEAMYMDTTTGLGMLGQEGVQAGAGSRVRFAATDKGLLKGAGQKRLKQEQQKYGSGTTTGLATSLAFTPVQGIELAAPDPLAQQQRIREANEKYFSHTASFVKVSRKPSQQAAQEQAASSSSAGAAATGQRDS